MSGGDPTQFWAQNRMKGFIAAIKAGFERLTIGGRCRLMCEPGRALVIGLRDEAQRAKAIEAIRTLDLIVLLITVPVADVQSRLPPHHGDPFDRILVAQAQVLDQVSQHAQVVERVDLAGHVQRQRAHPGAAQGVGAAFMIVTSLYALRSLRVYQREVNPTIDW